MLKLLIYSISNNYIFVNTIIIFGMQEIDYNDYIIHLNTKKVKQKQPKLFSDENNYCEKNIEEKPHKSYAGTVLLIVLVLLSFMLTIAFAGLLTTGSVLGVFSTGNQKGYYAVYKNVGDDFSKAQAQSSLVRSGGGGGNVIKIDNDYCVVYATYLDLAAAEDVASREEGLMVEALTISTLKATSDSGKKYVDTYNEIKVEAIEKLYDAAIEYSQSASENQLSGVLTALTSEYTELKRIVDADASLDTGEKLSIIVAIDTVCGRLEGILYADTSAETLSNLWYQIFNLI